MTSKENPVFPDAGSQDIVQLWKRDTKGRYWNMASDFVTTSKPKLMSGGILGGKTVQSPSEFRVTWAYKSVQDAFSDFNTTAIPE